MITEKNSALTMHGTHSTLGKTWSNWIYVRQEKNSKLKNWKIKCAGLYRKGVQAGEGRPWLCLLTDGV